MFINIKTARGCIQLLQLILLSMLILYFGRALFIPMFFGLLVAIVMYPVCLWLERKHCSRNMAIILSLAIVVVLFILLLLLMGWQIGVLKHELPELFTRVRPLMLQFTVWMEQHLPAGLSLEQDIYKGVVLNSTSVLGNWFQNLMDMTITTLFSLFLIPIYAALFLYHRKTFVRFIHRVLGENNRIRVDVILSNTIQTYFRYIKGMMLVYLIVGILNTIGLMLLGIEHALLFGMLTSLMTIIPYIGIIASAALPVVVALITRDSLLYPLGVIAVFSLVQYLEANIIFPKVVGKQLNTSTWATLVAVITGGIVWGVSGMVLFIPFVAILKIVSDNVEEMKALNIILNRNDHATV